MNPKILLIDDDNKWIEGVTALVGEDEVVSTHDGRNIGNILQNTPSIKLIITDTNMPGYSGIDVLQWVCQSQWKRLPVIVLFSGLDGSSIREEDIIKLGANLVMSKEAFLDSLPEVIEGFLRSP
jgi:DNA-binding response OmpR family regulator